MPKFCSNCWWDGEHDRCSYAQHACKQCKKRMDEWKGPFTQAKEQKIYLMKSLTSLVCVFLLLRLLRLLKQGKGELRFMNFSGKNSSFSNYSSQHPLTPHALLRLHRRNRRRLFPQPPPHSLLSLAYLSLTLLSLITGGRRRSGLIPK